jgi:hypothetical protein
VAKLVQDTFSREAFGEAVPHQEAPRQDIVAQEALAEEPRAEARAPQGVPAAEAGTQIRRERASADPSAAWRSPPQTQAQPRPPASEPAAPPAPVPQQPAALRELPEARPDERRNINGGASAHREARGREPGAMLSSETDMAVARAFNSLSRTVLSDNARTLEDLVTEMLRPLLKVWLDDNLPSLVERLVRMEIERVARGRPD